jgi:hypothetical protein
VTELGRDADLPLLMSGEVKVAGELTGKAKGEK